MTKKEIISAWYKIREENNTIPDDVLDFMKDCAIERIELYKSSREILHAKEVNTEQPTECGNCGNEINVLSYCNICDNDE